MFNMRAPHRLLPLLGGMALCGSLIAPLQAQSDSIRRTLGKHTFLPSTLLGDPFAGTYVRNLTGGGSAVGLQVPRLNLDDQIVEYEDATINFLQIGMEYQQSVTKWLAIRAGFTGGARLGTSATALLAEGVTAQFGATFGATARLIRSDRLIVSATADVLPQVAYQVSILDYVKDVVENGFDNASTSLVDESSPYRYRFGAQAAYSVAPWLGLQATGTVGPAKNQVDSTDTEVRFGAGASIDFDPIGPPIGVLLGYLYTDPAQGADVVGSAGITNVGIFYTGHKRLTVGLDMQFTSADQTQGEKKINVAVGRIVLRYDFK
jgi:hypothetical protein